MGFFDEDYGVKMAEGYLRQAEDYLRSCKKNREIAKQSNNYRNSVKNIRYKDKLGNGYDSNVWSAEELVKQRRAELAEAKKRAAEAKKKKLAKEREENKLAKEREKERLAEERKEKRNAAQSSKSSSRSSSSFRSSSSNYCGVNSYNDDDSSNYSNSDSASTNNERMKLATDALSVHIISSYKSSIQRTYPIETASDVDLVKWLPDLFVELKELELSCSQNIGCDQIYSVFLQKKQIAQAVAINACQRLKNLNLTLYNSPNVRKLVQQIDPTQQYGIIQKTTGLFVQLNELKNKPQLIVEQFKNSIVGKINKVVNPFNTRKNFIEETIGLIRKLLNWKNLI